MPMSVSCRLSGHIHYSLMIEDVKDLQADFSPFFIYSLRLHSRPLYVSCSPVHPPPTPAKLMQRRKHRFQRPHRRMRGCIPWLILVIFDEMLMDGDDDMRDGAWRKIGNCWFWVETGSHIASYATCTKFPQSKHNIKIPQKSKPNQHLLPTPVTPSIQG